MKKLTFRITIDATPEKIWNIIIGKGTYPIWTSVFSADSSVETDWQEGSKALFLDGTGSGMIAYIEAHEPQKFLSIKHVGMIMMVLRTQPATKSKTGPVRTKTIHLQRLMEKQNGWLK